MIPILSVAQMRAIDKTAIAGNSGVGFSYMMEAGDGLFEAARALISTPRGGDIVIVCGKGNNGGDGLTVGRLLLEAGYKVMCFCLCQPDELAGEARLAYDAYVGREGNFLVLDDIDDLGGLRNCSLIIDAVLGTGMKGNPHGFTAEVLEAINAANVPVLSADTPSGLDNDAAVPGTPCVKATTTVTMGFPKIGLYFYPGKSCVGVLRVKQLGYSEEVVEKHRSNLFLPDIDDLKQMLPVRKPAGSKFDHGIALVIAGSAGMTGSAALASMSALRTGCGMVHLATPKSALPALSAKLTEIVLHPIGETKSGCASLASSEWLLEKAATCHSVCIGPGLSHTSVTSDLVRAVVAASRVPVVLDADGISAYKGITAALKSHASPLVITPHAGEWARLFSAMPGNPVEIVEELCRRSKEFDMTILYKGNPTIVASPDGKVYLSPYGNSGMATAGSGDVLSGIITSLIAQGCSVTDAAILGAYIHAKAGDEAARELGEYSMIAGDILGNIYKAIRGLVG
jgi:NAD(P)H-hydrate epimerase